MKTVILAGGRGSRLAEETDVRPKPMVAIGGKPILWHLMTVYAAHGFREFVVACGYKGAIIKQYFSEVFFHHSDWMVDLRSGERTVVKNHTPDWRVHLVDTGLDTLTAGRLLLLRHLLEDETFMVTYGDGLGDVDITALVAFHRRHGKLATVTAVRPPARFGAIELDGDGVTRFSEKPQTKEGWINGGFFVFEPRILDYIDGLDVPLERAPLERLAADGQLMAYRHDGFWQPMDTIRDRQLLEDLWQSGRAPWAVGD
jgi:glucose-1-phosphate cytidylyltransferase